MANKFNFRLLSSTAALGLLLFACLNFFMLQAKPLAAVDPESLPEAHTWTWWATHEYLEQKKAPFVVLLGSSLVMHSVSRLDADYLGQNYDYVHHHYSSYLADHLSQKLGQDAGTCFNFALPGGMVSDDYMITRTMLTGFGKSKGLKPKVLVLGLSLRDFIDNGVHNAASTHPFRYLKRFTNIDDLVEASMPQLWQRLDYWQGKYIYLWDKKLDLQVALGQEMKQNCKPLLKLFSGGAQAKSQLDSIDPERNLPSNMRSEVEEGMFIVESKQPYSFEDNSAEYIKRYKNGNEFLFANQVQFLDKLLALAHAEGMEVIIGNMPLTKKNMALMPAGYYERYLSALKTEAGKWQYTFVDFNDANLFTEKEFYDTSHMNGQGGRKVADLLLEALNKDQKAVALLSNQAKGNTALASFGRSL